MQAVYNTPSVKDFHAAGFLVLYVHTRHTLTIQSAAPVPSCVSAVHFHCVPIETKSLVSFKTPQPACLLSVKMQTASISVFKRATIMKKENSLKAKKPAVTIASHVSDGNYMYTVQVKARRLSTQHHALQSISRP